MKAIIAALLTIALMEPGTGGASENGPKVLGWLESAVIHPEGIRVRTRLDTGARTASLDATHIVITESEGKTWVSFDVSDIRDHTRRLKKPLVRYANIKQHGGHAQKRPVVRLGVCVGDLYKEAEVNLVDREGLNYRMLIGRQFLAGRTLVDPAQTFTAKPVCPDAPR